MVSPAALTEHCYIKVKLKYKYCVDIIDYCNYFWVTVKGHGINIEVYTRSGTEDTEMVLAWCQFQAEILIE